MNTSGITWPLPSGRLAFIGLSALLAAVTTLVYWPVLGCSFINYDDPAYFTANSHVQAGLSLRNVMWAFQSGEAFNWHPLTWLSLMLDVSLFGAKASWVHFTNLVFHILNVLLLFGLWHRLTNSMGPSAFLADLFAWHPLHVESVAWVSERKDVLSTFFGFLALLFYAYYAQGKELV